MTYCVSDLHGEYAKYLSLLEKIHFSAEDTLYIIGDTVDRGPQPITLLQDIMQRENVITLAGNHDLLACMFLKRLIYGGRMQDLTEDVMVDILMWQQDGGASTLKEFHALSIPEREDVVEWLEDLELYREVSVNGTDFVLVHTGLGPKASPSRPLEDYTLEECLFQRSDYKAVYPDKYIVSGHTPISDIPGNPDPNRIYRVNRHIAIDCGCTFGGPLAAICLETDEEFYV